MKQKQIAYIEDRLYEYRNETSRNQLLEFEALLKDNASLRDELRIRDEIIEDLQEKVFVLKGEKQQ